MGNVIVRFTLAQRVEAFGIEGGSPGVRVLWETTGIRLRGRQPLNFLPPERSAEVEYRNFSMPDVMADRLATFVRTHYFAQRPYFDCYSFMHDMLGWDRQRPIDSAVRYIGPTVSLLEAQPFSGYVLRRSSSQTSRRMLAAVALTPDLFMTILGANGAIMLAYPGELMSGYGAYTLQQVDKAVFDRR